MRIEDFWVDQVIYNVDFMVNVPSGSEDECKKISKTLIMPNEITLPEIETVIFAKFKRVTEIIRIDEVMDGLSMKDV